MTLCFTLTMPGRGSWNGQWSGQENLYAVLESFASKKAKAKAAEILTKGHYSYSWSDGWRALITVYEITRQDANKIRKHSMGFCGYEWMVRSILSYGKILDDSQLPTQQICDRQQPEKERERVCRGAPDVSHLVNQ